MLARMADDQSEWVSGVAFFLVAAIVLFAAAMLGFLLALNDGDPSTAIVSWRLVCGSWMSAVLSLLLAIRNSLTKAE